MNSVNPTPLYSSLDYSRTEIRVIEAVSYEDDDSPVQCQLQVVSLLDNPEYAALSYVWGDPTKTKDIILNGRVVPVTVSLGLGLQYASRHTTSRFLWADAVCINQKDIAERSAQVQLMGSIYECASVVLACLDPNDGVIPLAIERLSLISTQLRKHEKGDRIQWMQQFPQLCEDFEFGKNKMHNTWASINAFLRHSYWERVWILQEMVLAKSLRIVCRTQSINYDDLKRVCEWLDETSTSDTSPPFIPLDTWARVISPGWLDWNKVLYVSSLISILSSDKHRLNRHVFEIADQRHATDPRDHIYGLLGILRADVIPDYTKSVSKVYSDFVRDWILKFRSFDFLGLAGVGLDFEDKFGLPSWCPNLPARSTGGAMLHILRFGADDGLRHRIAQEGGVDGDTLTAYGLRLCTVSTISKMELFAKHSTPLSECLEKFITRTTKYKAGIHPVQAVFRALLLDRKPGTGAGRLDFRDESTILLAVHFLMTYFPPPGIEGGENYSIHFDKAFREIFPFDFEFPYGNVYGWAMKHLAADGRFGPIAGTLLSQYIIVQSKHRFFETSDGYLGLAPLSSCPGDIVCMIKWFGVPVILRGVGSHYAFIGSCFVLGLMNGEAAQILDSRKEGAQKFSIV